MKNKQIIIDLNNIFLELERRNFNALATYNSGQIIHQKQMDFHKSRKRNRWVFGGNRTGKTECGAVETIWLARGIHPFRENKKDVVGWVVSLSNRVQEDVVQEQVVEEIAEEPIQEEPKAQEQHENVQDLGLVELKQLIQELLSRI